MAHFAQERAAVTETVVVSPELAAQFLHVAFAAWKSCGI